MHDMLDASSLYLEVPEANFEVQETSSEYLGFRW